MNFIINRKHCVNFATHESHYKLPKGHNHIVSAKYGVAKFSNLNFALHVAYMPSRRLRRLDMLLTGGGPVYSLQPLSITGESAWC